MSCFYCSVVINNDYSNTIDNNQKQEAQLPQRNSASAAHMEGGWG